MTTNSGKYKMIYLFFVGAIIIELTQIVDKFNIIDFSYLIILIIYFFRYLLVKRE